MLTFRPVKGLFLSLFLFSDPLIALIVTASIGFLYLNFLYSLILIFLTIFLGRSFCGYLCPLGFFIDLTQSRKKTLKPAADIWRENLSRIPVLILISFMIIGLFGYTLPLIFDPIAISSRTLTAVIFPILDRVLSSVGDLAYNFSFLQPSVDNLTVALHDILLFERPLHFQGQFLIVTLLVAVLSLSFFGRRFWCRYVCPLGALLGQISKLSIFKRTVIESKCIECGKCLGSCPMDAISENGKATNLSRCFLCLECKTICPTSAIFFGRKVKTYNYEPSRRAFITTGALSIAGGLLLTTQLSNLLKNPNLIRPPGAREEHSFIGWCTRCGQCMRVCPTNVIQPSLFAGGVESLWSPQLIYNHAYCDWSCRECSQICPTGAIENLTLAQKRKRVIGIAHIDRGRCIPWSDFQNCLVCEELCPIPDKAIEFIEETVENPRGGRVKLKRPHVIKEACIGCGICQYNCPIKPERAIKVHAILT